MRRFCKPLAAILAVFALATTPAPAHAESGQPGQAAVAVICDDGNPCTFDVFVDPNCFFLPEPDGTLCDDGLFCTGEDRCFDGQCQAHEGDPCKDSAGASTGLDACISGCDEETDSCGSPSNPIPNTDGWPCDDGVFCNGADFCEGGVCDVHTGDPCVGADGDADCRETCDETVQACTKNDPDGSLCDDGLFCNGGDYCQAGECADHDGDPCESGDECAPSCVELVDSCVGNSDGLPCDDGVFCNGDDSCSAGACVVHDGDPCVGADGDEDCAESCDEFSFSCTAPDPNGTACDDQVFCNGDASVCNDGACVPNGPPPCDGFCETCDEDTSSCFIDDADGDGSCAEFDNCPTVFNPDQYNADCPDPSFALSGGCDGEVPDWLTGCCDGGDVCDLCPAARNPEDCIAGLSGAATVDSAGGSYLLGACVGIDVPDGAVDVPTTLSVTTLVDPGPQSVGRMFLLPGDPQLNAPITIVPCWSDWDDDGLVDLGLCGDGTTACDDDFACEEAGAPGPCSTFTAPDEKDLVLRYDGSQLDASGDDGGPTLTCGDPVHQNFETCGDTDKLLECAGGSIGGAIAGCCDTKENGWPIHLCQGGQFSLGTIESDTIPGGGSSFTDCFLELAVQNPNNPSGIGRDGRLNPSQVCTDGDPLCDADGKVDGQCTLFVSMYVNVEDSLLVHKSTNHVLCTPSDIAKWEIRKPRPTSSKPWEAEAGTRLRDAIQSLSPGSTEVTGRHMNAVEFDPAFGAPAAATRAVEFVLPLKQKGSSFKKSKGTVVLGVETRTDETGAVDRRRDKDKLKITCLPAD